jgi:hypothetical protein
MSHSQRSGALTSLFLNSSDEGEMEIESQPNNFLAFRSSCDRCRYMKLKCPSNSAEPLKPCDRCLKAKLPCTYSRRTHLSRRSTAGQNSPLDSTESHNRMPTPDVLIEDQELAQGDRSPNSIGVRIPEVQSEHIDPFCYSNALEVVGTEPLWADWDVPSTESTAHLWPMCSSPFSEHRESLSAQCMLSLADLAVELGECLQLLRSDVRTQSIDDYPIGHIRHVSQAFVASSQNTSIFTTHVSTTLLLLSCYVSLRKLYISAFANMKDQLPVGNANLAQLSHVQNHRNMKLRGLDMLGERCMKSYTAFNITLDLMHNCDIAIGLCAHCRPPGQPTSPSSSSSILQSQSGDKFGTALEHSTSACVACALPASFRKEAASVFSIIGDQEQSLHEVIALLKGILRQQMGLV